MTDYSDAALLKGDYAHMAAELRAGKRSAPTPEDWQKAPCTDEAERAARAIAQQIFGLQTSIDAETERLEITTLTAAGPMIVTGLHPAEGDLLRIDGHLTNPLRPAAHVVHASQLALTISKRPAAETAEEDDGVRIGFVIFDELAKRAGNVDDAPTGAGK